MHAARLELGWALDLGMHDDLQSLENALGVWLRHAGGRQPGRKAAEADRDEHQGEAQAGKTPQRSSLFVCLR